MQQFPRGNNYTLRVWRGCGNISGVKGLNMSTLEIADRIQYLNGKPVPEWLTRKETSKLLERLGSPIAPRTLEKMASNENAGKGPPFTRSGWRIVRYNRDDVVAWQKTYAKRIA